LLFEDYFIVTLGNLTLFVNLMQIKTLSIWALVTSQKMSAIFGRPKGNL
jgi:hypothetical protein